LVPAKFAVMVVLPSPTVSPVTVTVQELVVQVSEDMETVPVPEVPKDHVNNPVGVELPSVTVALHEVVDPTATVSGLQVTEVAVEAAVIDRASDPKLEEKSLVPAKFALMVVLPSPTVNPATVTVHELAEQLSADIDTVPAPGEP